MQNRLAQLITSPDAAVRSQSLDAFCRGASLDELVAEANELEAFRRRSENLYERVRALFFLYAIHRFHLPLKPGVHARSLISFHGHAHLLQRRFEEAIANFLKVQTAEGPSDPISSALAVAYYRLAIQTLADQVRRSVRSVRGNQWMFRMGHPADHPLRLRRELLARGGDGTYPILREATPVRMDLTHCGWSDIFFLGMDYPEGAKVLNVSIDLGVRGRDAITRPPIETYLRVIDEPLLRLTSVDLGATADITNLADVFDFAKDYLGLLKAAVIASGIVPPGVEGSGQNLADLLALVVGPGRGLELVSNVNAIPKGSRLAVSTNLLASMISLCMRATGQAASLTGALQEDERRLILARALLGEWLGGSGGGWQDSGGVWPGMKLIEGVIASEGDPEFGISRGRLMPQHRILDSKDASPAMRQKLQDSLVLVHGGMAQNVGPILEMVTEKYLLRSEAEWKARLSMLGILDEILAALRKEDVPAIGSATTRNFAGPIQTIIPWATNLFTETLISRVRTEFGKNFLGFWMLGGMSGGGMGFIFDPRHKAQGQSRLQDIMSQTKRELEHALPFAMEPVVYDFAINERGTWADLLHGRDALMPQGYYALIMPQLLRQQAHELPPLRRTEVDKFGAACRTQPELRGMVQTLFDRLLPRLKTDTAGDTTLEALLQRYGFDRAQHEQIRSELKAGRIGLAQNRLPVSTQIEDVRREDVTDATNWPRGNVLASGAGVPPATVAADVSSAGPVLPFRAFDPKRPASISQRRLPHWQQEGATYFVTFRLADSLPKKFEQDLLQERNEWLKQQGGNLTPERAEELKWFYREKLEAELDRGHGDCALRDAPVADIVEGALKHFEGQRYWLGSYAVMPNHVHVLVRPIMEHRLPDILHSWKSFTAHEIGKRRRTAGTFWQDESFDHIVRNEQELEKFSRYIQESPVKAKLPTGTFRLGLGSEARTPQPKPAGTAGATVAGGTPAPLLKSASHDQLHRLGLESLTRGEVAVVSLAAGAGSRWTQGAGTVKALHPFCKLGGKHRTFIEVHLAKSRHVGRLCGTPLPHIFTTSYLSHDPTRHFLEREKFYGYDGPVFLSEGRAVGLRLIPTERDLRFMWEEMPQQMLDEQQQKVRDSLRQALIGWARQAGEAGDYTDNVPLQCLHPVGHWFEIPNLLRNGTLARLLEQRPQLKHLMLHNVDTVGANVDPAMLGLHMELGGCLSFEVITRRIEDRGGGLARVNGQPRIVEGLALAREEDEFNLSFYNSMTTWIDLDKLLVVFQLTRADLADEAKVAAAVRELAAKLPTYITLKDVKKRWGHGQEDIFPVAQFEKLWSDMTALPEVDCKFIVVPRFRGQQLKDQSQLDGWLRDGSAAYVESLCAWE
ncbi:MAG: transposase [Verrucomicrobia bacterium]|jgi:REP element-mobilizing transposase RayT|nr:transposase [Verrucomicrobiota bacterium]